jgi:hypothetical protein
VSADKNYQQQIVACKALCNLALDFDSVLVREEAFLGKLVELTYTTNMELKLVCCYTIKNMVFKAKSDTRDTILKELTVERLNELLDEDSSSDAEQVVSI